MSDYKPDQAQFDFEAATAGRDAGITAAVEATGDEWQDHALIALKELCLGQIDFIVDDLWASGLDRPSEGRAIAGILRKGQSLGWCEKSGAYRASAQRQCHANPRMIWRSLICQLREHA